MSSPAFDLTQTAFLFNWIANSSSQQQGTPQQLADYVYWSLYGAPANSETNVFPSLRPPGLFPTLGAQLVVSDWQLTWGPGVFEFVPSSTGRADNTAYVVYSPSLNLYVVAVAGTDPAAFLDWFDEDFQVGANACVNWSGFNPLTGAQPAGIAANSSVPQISLGTAIGLWALAGQLTPSQFAPAATKNLSLGAYLQQLASTTNSTATLLFTGHSLGGALSPTLANWFVGQIPSTNLSKPVVYAMPTAGPTPGNSAYQSAWDALFPQTAVSTLPSPFNPPVTPSPYVSTQIPNSVTNLNNDVWNQDDVVPHAWQYIYTPNYQDGSTPGGPFYFSEAQTQIVRDAELKTLLGPIVPGTIFRNLTSACQAKGTAAFMTRSSHTTNFANQWPIATDSGSVPAPIPPYLGDDSGFLSALAAIHVWGYGGLGFGLTPATFQAIKAVPVVL